MVKVKKKCKYCKLYFLVEHNGRKTCDKCIKRYKIKDDKEFDD